MKFFDFYLKRFIGNMEPEEFKQVLERTHPNITVRQLNNRTMFLSNKKIIKCINAYYNPPEDKSDIFIPKTNHYAACEKIKQIYGIKNSSGMECRWCHLSCISLEKNNYIKRKI